MIFGWNLDQINVLKLPWSVEGFLRPRTLLYVAKSKIGNRGNILRNKRNTEENRRKTVRNMQKHQGEWQETVKKLKKHNTVAVTMIITGI